MSRRSTFCAAVGCVLVIVTTSGSVGAAEPPMKTVSFRGVAVSVPAAWPVYDLERDTNRCARLDEHAVYLGRQDPDAACPALIVGRTETVQLEPWTPGRGNGSLPRRPARINGEDALVDPTSRAGGTIASAFPRARVLVTVTFGAERQLAEEIADSAQVTSAGSQSASDTSRSSPASPRSDGGGVEPASILEPAGVTADQPTALQPGIFSGEGFDACTAQTREKLENWLASPYRAVGIYIGGINRGCSQPELNAAWVADVARMGWSFIPTYVGLQAPCTSYTNKINPSTAAGQGSSAANDAITQADLLGLPAGSPIYFDMEAFPYSDTACRTAVLRFLSGWSTRLQSRGYLSGVYGSAGSTMRALVDVYNSTTYRRPNAIWNARWGAQEHSVFDDPVIPNTYWPNHQRIHQYRGGHIESWGGSSINIDNNFLDGPVVRRLAVAKWLSADVSADGRTDLVHLCCRDYANTWLSNGDGTYTVKSYRPAVGYGVQMGKWLAADTSGDGKTDLVHLCCADVLNVWTSAGDGTYAVTGFRPAAGYAVQQGQWLAGDFTGDGRADLLHLCCTSFANLWVSNGNGTFSRVVFRPTSNYYFPAGSWRIADVDANGRADLVHLCCREAVNVFLSLGNGTFARRTFHAPAGYDTRLGSWTVADVEGDGDADLVHLCCPDYLHTWLSNGTGTPAFTIKGFRWAPGYAIGIGSWFPSDANGDEKVDLIHNCCGDYLNTWMSNGDGTYVVTQFRARPGYGQQMGSWRTGNIDGDATGDLIHLCCDGMLNSWLSNGAGGYTVVGSPI